MRLDIPSCKPFFILDRFSSNTCTMKKTQISRTYPYFFSFYFCRARGRCTMKKMRISRCILTFPRAIKPMLSTPRISGDISHKSVFYLAKKRRCGALLGSFERGSFPLKKTVCALLEKRSNIYVYICKYVYIYVYIYTYIPLFSEKGVVVLLWALGLKKAVLGSFLGSFERAQISQHCRGLFCERDLARPVDKTKRMRTRLD